MIITSAQTKWRVVVATLSVAAATIGGTLIFAARRSDDVTTDRAKKPRSTSLAQPLVGERRAPEPPRAILIRAIRDKKRALLICTGADMHFGHLVEYLLDLELRVTADGRVADAEILTLVVRKTRASNGSVTETEIPSDDIENMSLGRCVLEKAKGWRFPAFDGMPGVVQVPLVLEGS